MKSNDKIDRNQFMMTSLDEMIDENSNVRVIDAGQIGTRTDSGQIGTYIFCQLSVE